MLTKAKLKYIKSLKSSAGIKSEDRFIIEGERFVNDISDTSLVDFVILSDGYKGELRLLGVRVYSLSSREFKKLSDTDTPQGILAVCIRPKPSLDNFLHRDVRIVVLDNVRDPGNLGSIIRTAVCAGFDLVLCLSGCACAYSGKAVRSSAGSIFNIDVIENLRTDDAMPKLKSAGIAVFVTRLENAVVPYDVSLASNCAIVIGNEAVGVSKTVCNYADSFLRLPMEGVQSLNASIACGIILYESVRQRRMMF